MSDTEMDACEKRYNELRKTIRWGIGILIVIGLAFIPVIAMSMSAGYIAQNELDQHTARQNGSLETIQTQFESIQSQLSSLRTYHSTLRGEMRDQKVFFSEQMKDQRVVLDELLLRSQPNK